MRAAALALLMLAAGCAGARPTPAPRGEGMLLEPCPASPNCVSSEATDDAHRVAPLAYQGDPAAAMARLRDVLAAMPRATVTQASGEAIHAEFRSRIFRFVDDVDCVVDPERGAIAIRSASRLGYSDFGVNRARVEEIRRLFGDG